MEKAMRILEQIKSSCLEALSTKLVGIYIHGSLAFGCFNWDKSDIDFIVVTPSSPTLEEKERLITALMKIEAPPKGLEMSVVLEKYCRDFIYPTPFELHFSNEHKQRCIENLSGYCADMNGTDKDLAAHFAVIRQVGITLYGTNANALFGEVSKESFLDSVKADIENAVDEITKNPVYIILNLCRVLAYIKEGTILSKQQGGSWGIERFPQYAGIIETALEGRDFSMNRNELEEFAKYMLKQIG